MIKMVGKKGEQEDTHTYIKTGMYSMDRAFNLDGKDLGIPIGGIWEIYGANSTGKSTLCYSLASILASLYGSGWALGDVEDAFTPEYVLNIAEALGMGSDHLLAIAEGEFHEDKMQDLFTNMSKYELIAGIWDSIGMTASRAELEGELGGANMGKRAFLVNQFCRKFLHYRRIGYVPKLSTLFLINHQQPRLSGYGGMYTPGGEGKGYAAGAIIHLKREIIFDDGSFGLKGTVKKLRWGEGGRDNTFQVVLKRGYGLSKNLTNLFDAKSLKFWKQINGTVKIEKESLGRVSGFFEDHQNEEKFAPIYELLENENE